MNIATSLADRARENADRVAIFDRSHARANTVTFAELDARARAAAGALSQSLRPGERVVVLCAMSTELYVALAGVLYAGGVPVVFDPGMGRSRVTRALARINPKAIIASPAGHAYSFTIPALRGAKHYTPGSLMRRRTLDAIAERDDDDAAVVSFTSGSTGEPKVIARTHGVLHGQLDAIRSALPIDGVNVATMPLVMLANLASGVSSVIPSIDLRHPAGADAHGLARDIAATGATTLVASPAILERIIESPVEAAYASLRRVFAGGAPVMPSLVTALQQRYPTMRVTAVYGSTEAEPIAALAYDDVDGADIDSMRDGGGLLAGRPVEGCAVQLLDERNGIGEIAVSGAHVVAAPGQWYATGDMGRIDRAGRLWLLGRRTASSHDESATYPLSLECALSFDSTIKHSAFANHAGRRVLALERANAAMDLSAIRVRLGSSLDDIVEVEHIPMDRRHNAKVDYPKLERMLKVRPASER